jgi:hypothetical protein
VKREPPIKFISTYEQFRLVVVVVVVMMVVVVVVIVVVVVGTI